MSLRDIADHRTATEHGAASTNAPTRVLAGLAGFGVVGSAIATHPEPSFLDQRYRISAHTPAESIASE